MTSETATSLDEVIVRSAESTAAARQGGAVARSTR